MLNKQLFMDEEDWGEESGILTLISGQQGEAKKPQLSNGQLRWKPNSGRLLKKRAAAESLGGTTQAPEGEPEEGKTKVYKNRWDRMKNGVAAVLLVFIPLQVSEFEVSQPG